MVETCDNLQPGDGATYRIYTDCYACTVISNTGRVIVAQRDKATLQNGVNSGAADALQFAPGGFSGHTSGAQRYTYESNPKGELFTFSKRKNGKWKLKGTVASSPGSILSPGRREHYDFNF